MNGLELFGVSFFALYWVTSFIVLTRLTSPIDSFELPDAVPLPKRIPPPLFDFEPPPVGSTKRPTPPDEDPS